MLNSLQFISPSVKKIYSIANKSPHWYGIRKQTTKPLEVNSDNVNQSHSEPSNTELTANNNEINVYPPMPRVVPMLVRDKDPVVLPFDEVPGPKSLKYLSTFRNYLSEIGTQMMANFLRFGLNMGTLLNSRKHISDLSTLFDEYGPVVRFVSPVGGDIVLINHPEHIQKVFNMESEHPIRSTLESLERYRIKHKNQNYAGPYSVHGQEWVRQRSIMCNPARSIVTEHSQEVFAVCDKFTQKIYNGRNYQDEISKDLYRELHKWAFDCMGVITFSKNFQLLDTELVHSQCDPSWMYHSLEKATDAIIKCETGMHLWKFFTTPAWYSLVKYCDILDSLIGKYVLEVEHELSVNAQGDNKYLHSLASAMLFGENKFKTEDIATVLMDVLLIGVNTITTSMFFFLYNIAKHQKCQRQLYQEISNLSEDVVLKDVTKLRENTPYLQACLKETLRLVPPIPLLTRILSRNITLDGYNIPHGTLIIMSIKDASLKESNYDHATYFYPERWLKPDCREYHAFASIPFGFGVRKCVGQSIAETILSLLIIRVLQKYKLEYHYGEVQPTRSFIVRPNKPLKIRFVDRV